jgi:hypothetical protein
MAAPNHKPTDEDRKQVKLLALIRLPEQDIADYLGCSVKNLRKHFHKELESGWAEGADTVAGTLITMAESEKDPAANTAWLELLGTAQVEERATKPGTMTVVNVTERENQKAERRKAAMKTPNPDESGGEASGAEGDYQDAA